MTNIGWRHWRYMLYRAYYQLISDAFRYRLGWVWWFLEPALMAGVFYVVFSYLRPSGKENFIFFLLIGVMMWLWFSGSVMNSTQSLVNGKSLILQMRLPKMIFPIIAVLSATYKQTIVIALILVIVLIEFGASWSWLALPFLFLLQLLLAIVSALTAALVCTWLPDFRFIIGSGMQLMMFCSGIFYAIEDMPDNYQWLFRLNPMATLIDSYRNILMEGILLNMELCLWFALLCLVWLIGIVWMYRKLDQPLTRKIIIL